MDWAKAKNIFIVVFIVLNIFLLSTILFTNSTLRFQSDYTRFAKEYLQSKDIQIDTKIQDKTGQVGIMVYVAKSFNFSRLTRYVFDHEISQSIEANAIVYSESDENITLVGDELFIRDRLDDGASLFHRPKDFSQKVYKYLNDIGYSNSSLCLQSEEGADNQKKMVFILKFKNGLLFDQTITATMDEEGFLTLSLPAREVKHTNVPKEEILSAYQVLVMGALPDGSLIKSVDFGYRQISKGEMYDSPVWRILFRDGAITFYDAYTGEKL